MSLLSFLNREMLGDKIEISNDGIATQDEINRLKKDKIVKIVTRFYYGKSAPGRYSILFKYNNNEEYEYRCAEKEEMIKILKDLEKYDYPQVLGYTSESLSSSALLPANFNTQYVVILIVSSSIVLLTFLILWLR